MSAEYIHKERSGAVLGIYRATEMRAAQSTVTLLHEQAVIAVINLLPGERIIYNPEQPPSDQGQGDPPPEN